MQNPKNLFHYTSIESLSYILSSRKIKFKRLDLMDDMLDGKTADNANISKFYYVSSWSSCKKESLPFWNMYTPDMKGVRIELSPYPFEYYSLENGEFISHKDINSEIRVSPIHPNEYSFSSELALMFYPKNDFLKKIEYVENLEKRIKDFFYMKDGISGFDPNIGLIKSDHWKFQEEWRYVLKFIPMAVFNKKYSNIEQMIRETNKISNKIDSLLLSIEKTCFEKMRIVIGPKATESEKLIIEALLHKYNPTAELSESELKGKIR